MPSVLQLAALYAYCRPPFGGKGGGLQEHNMHPNIFDFFLFHTMLAGCRPSNCSLDRYMIYRHFTGVVGIAYLKPTPILLTPQTEALKCVLWDTSILACGPIHTSA